MIISIFGGIRYLRGEEDAPLLIETDTSAPDVWKAYKDDIESQCIDLEQRDGWLELLDVLDRHADTAIVINTKAAMRERVTAKMQRGHGN
jgi:hypothetical protein